MLQSIIDFFAHISSGARAGILVGGIALFWIIESWVPLFHFSYQKGRHALLNMFFTLTTIVVNFLLAGLLLYVSNLTAERTFGIWWWLEIPLLAKLILGLLLMDFIGAYCAHYAEHRMPLLWRFHAIHHMDKQVDTTTANRHHPVESVIRFLFTLLAVALIGAPMWLVMLYQSMSVVLSQFNHANITLPVWLEKCVGWFIVTPQMHKVHHHYKMPYTDTNYGNIFSVWDYLFRTHSKLPNEELTYGLDVVFDRNEANLKDQMILPFHHTMTTGKGKD